MNQIGLERLLKLANHLESGEMTSNTEFDFNPLWECPTVFPRHWIIDTDNTPVLISLNSQVENSAMTFFGITQTAVYHLFYAGCQNLEVYGGKPLDADSLPSDFAANIRAFVELKKNTPKPVATQAPTTPPAGDAPEVYRLEQSTIAYRLYFKDAKMLINIEDNEISIDTHNYRRNQTRDSVIAEEEKIYHVDVYTKSTLAQLESELPDHFKQFISAMMQVKEAQV